MLLLLLIMFFILAVYIYKKREKPMLKIILCFIGYIILSIGIAEFPNTHGKGMSTFIGLIYFASTIILILSGLLLILYVVFESKIKSTSSMNERFKYINGYTASFVIVVLTAIGFSLNNYAETKHGELLGFTTNMDFSEAKRHNIYSADEYSKFLAEKKSKEETELAAKAERKKIEEEERSALTFNTEAYKELYPSYKNWDVSQVHNMFVDSVYGRGKLYMNTSGVDGNGNNFVYIYEFNGDKDKTFHMAMNDNEAKEHYSAIAQVLRTVKKDSIEQTEVTTVHGQSSNYVYFYRYDTASKQLFMGICNSSLECTSFDQQNTTELAKNVYSIFKPLADYYKN